MKKKVSVEVRRIYLHQIINMELKLKKLGMEIKESRREIGSIFGLLPAKYFDDVESWNEIMGVFEVDRLPGELPTLPGEINKEATKA